MENNPTTDTEQEKVTEKVASSGASYEEDSEGDGVIDASEDEESVGQRGGKSGAVQRAATKKALAFYAEGSGSEDDDYESQPEEDVLDDNDEHCKACGSNEKPEKLLCCDNCPNVYHLNCLDPPRLKIPRGDWFCPECEEKFELGDVERILDSRKIPSGNEGGGEIEELYVKWKNKAYMHCSWVKRSHLEAVQKLFPSVRSKLRKWTQVGLQLENPEEFENGVNKKWLLVDKILSKSDAKSTGLSYLAKWQGLPYDEATWESENDLGEFQDAIHQFEKQETIREEARRRRAELQRKNSPEKHTRKKQKKMKRNEEGKQEGHRMFSATPDFLSGGTLHPYQLEGLNWLFFKWQQKENVILADEMGLGKTIQSIAFITALWNECIDRPHLIVVPLSTMRNWEREFSLWAPHLKVVSLYGSLAAREYILKYERFSSAKNGSEKANKFHRREDLQDRVKFHVLLTSYEMVIAHSADLRKVDYECLIVDEGHRLKTKNSKLVQELSTINFSHRILLTGTPLQNNIQELFMLMHFLDGRKFDSWTDFEESFAEISQEDQVSKLHALLSPHLLRRLKKDVLKQLPPKKEQIVRVELAALQKTVYKEILTLNYSVLSSGKVNSLVKGGMRNIMMELRKCCLHPYLIEGVEPAVQDQKLALEKLIQSSGKLELLDKMLVRLKEEGHRVLIYSQFTMMLDVLEDMMAGRKWGYQRIDGSVGGSDRQARIDRFNSSPGEYFIFLLSTKAGGLGINLATADTVVIYDSDWNPHNDLQAQARAHRLGQQNAVMIYRLITRGTIEERMMQMTKRKMVLEHLVVRKMGSKNDLKQEELDDILRYGAQELFEDDNENKEQDGKQQTDNANQDKRGGVIYREAARLAGKKQAGRIVYDDTALEKLLDRSDLTQKDTEEDGEDKQADDNLMTSFKVANFEVINGGQAESSEEEKEPEAPPPTLELTPNFWDNLLQEKHNQLKLKEAATEQVGGKRRRGRRDVNYNLSASGMDVEVDASSDDFEVDPDAQSQDESLDAMEIDMPRTRAKKRKVSEGHLNAGESGKRHKLHSGDQNDSVRPPLLAQVGGELRVLGYGPKDRQNFLHCLMRHGLPEGVLTGATNVDWREFKARLPRKRHKDIHEYARVVVRAVGDERVDGIPPEVVLFDWKPEDILSRIGMLHLFRTKLKSPSGRSKETFTVAGAQPNSKLLQTRYWKLEHDWCLLSGVIKYGYGRWREILKDPELDLQEPLNKELNITWPYTKEDTPQKSEKSEPQVDKSVPDGGSGKDDQDKGNNVGEGSGAGGETGEKLPNGVDASGDVIKNGVNQGKTDAGVSGNTDKAGKNGGGETGDGGSGKEPLEVKKDGEKESDVLNPTRLKYLETRCRTWLGNRLKLLAEALDGEELREDAVKQERKVPAMVQHAPAQFLQNGVQGLGRGRGRGRTMRSRQAGDAGQSRTTVHVIQQPVQSQNSGRAPRPSGLPISTWYPGNTGAEISARLNLVSLYNSLCLTCQRIRTDASNVASVHSQDALMQAGVRFRKQLEELESRASSMLDRIPPGNQLPPLVQPTKQVQPQARYVVRSVPPNQATTQTRPKTTLNTRAPVRQPPKQVIRVANTGSGLQHANARVGNPSNPNPIVITDPSGTFNVRNEARCGTVPQPRTAVVQNRTDVPQGQGGGASQIGTSVSGGGGGAKEEKGEGVQQGGVMLESSDIVSMSDVASGSKDRDKKGDKAGEEVRLLDR